MNNSMSESPTQTALMERNGEDSTNNDEDLPFAIMEEVEKPLHKSSEGESSTLASSSSQAASSQILSGSSTTAASPSGAVSSSVLSSDGGHYGTQSLSTPSSQYLDAAASMLLPNSLLGSLSRLTETCRDRQALDESTDTFQSTAQSSADYHRLPILPEDEQVDEQNATTTATTSLRTPQGRSILMHSHETILAASSVQDIRRPERRMASLAGATATRTSDASFRIAIDLSNDVTAAQVMQVLGNPEMLHLWCDCLPSLLITKRTERSDADASREYEGEWIEGTTSELQHPPNLSRLHKVAHGACDMLGFPCTGHAGMFVEPTKHQMGLSVGGFAGRIEVSHKLTVERLSERKVRIVDVVRLVREQGEAPCCGLYDIMEKPFLPTVDDYMDQVLSSMARLRFLIEQGEATTQGGYTPPPLEQEAVSLLQ